MPIRNTLPSTKRATFSIELPNANKHGMRVPAGTGFLISEDGWFVTAAHVVTDPKGAIRVDLKDAYLNKEIDMFINKCPVGLNGLTCELTIKELDFALLKVDFSENKKADWLKNANGFPYIEVSSRELEEGEPVYSFGYPLSEGRVTFKNDQITIGETNLCPRTTSSIISSTLEKTKMVMSPGDPKHYVLDKALNYGNSGGPIISVETGKAHAFCSRFQPVVIPQNHLKDKSGDAINIYIPSLYGVVYSLGDPRILSELHKRNIKITTE